jgi:hypothetical protein
MPTTEELASIAQREIGREPIKVPHQKISSGVRLRDILADLAFPIPQMISAPGNSDRTDWLAEDKAQHERAMMREWGERPPTEDKLAAMYEKDFLQNAGELAPSVPRFLQIASGAKKYGSALGGATKVLKKAGPAALLGGALIEPALEKLGAWYGSRGIEGGTIIPGGDPEAHQRAREQRRREAEAARDRLIEQRKASSLPPDYYSLGSKR